MVTVPIAGAHLQNGKYLIHQVLNRGLLDITLHATHCGLNQPVLVKTINVLAQEGHHLAALIDQFLAKAQELARFCHPHLVRVSDCFLESGLPYMVMDYVPGPTLAEATAVTPLSEATARTYIQQVGHALEFIHALGLQHGNISPHSIVLHPQTQTAVLTDFGGSVHLSGPAATHAHPSGYLPPEQTLPHTATSAASDIYALAATLYAVTTGTQLLSSWERRTQTLPSPRQLNPALSQALETAILSGMAQEPSLRPATIQDWLSRLTDAGSDHHTTGEANPNPTDVPPAALTSMQSNPSTQSANQPASLERYPQQTSSRRVEHPQRQLNRPPAFPLQALFWSAAIAGCGGVGAGLFLKTQVLAPVTLKGQLNGTQPTKTIQESFPPNFSYQRNADVTVPVPDPEPASEEWDASPDLNAGTDEIAPLPIEPVYESAYEPEVEDYESDYESTFESDPSFQDTARRPEPVAQPAPPWSQPDRSGDPTREATFERETLNEANNSTLPYAADAYSFPESAVPSRPR